jgi:hypothetical protein
MAGRAMIDQPFTACTFCGRAAFENGPRGGVCVNVTCLYCGARFNIFEIPEASYPDGVDMPPLDERRRLAEVLSGPTEDEAALPIATRALRAVLMFYRVEPWDDAARRRWQALTGANEATTKALADLVRAAIAAG